MKWLSDEKEFDIRYSNLDDHAYLEKWLKYPEVMRWYPTSSNEDVDRMSKNWIGFSKYGASLTAVYKNEPVGIATLFLMPYRKVIHHCMLYFVVNPEFTERGVGTSLVKNITHLGKSYFSFERMHIELFEGCPATSILKKAGYKEVFRQKHFVKEGEDRYLSRFILEVDLGENNGK